MSTRLLLAVAAVPALAAGCGAGAAAPRVASLTTGAAKTGSTKPIVKAGGSFAKFVTCMRRHGVQAELAPQGHGVSIGPGPGKSFINGAQAACQKYLPGGGPPSLTPAQRAAQIRALLAAARCMRRNGIPNFPDPNAQGQFASGPPIDKSSPAVRAAIKKCGKLIPRQQGPHGG